jgi:hypothetical protein
MGDHRATVTRAELDVSLQWAKEHPLLAVKSILAFLRSHHNVNVGQAPSPYNVLLVGMPNGGDGGDGYMEAARIRLELLASEDECLVELTSWTDAELLRLRDLVQSGTDKRRAT